VNTHELDFCEQSFVIRSGLAEIQLGIFLKLSRSYLHKHPIEKAIPLAYCVVNDAFLEPIKQPTLDKFYQDNKKMVETELKNVYFDSEINEAISFAYAAKLILLEWETHSPFNETANSIIENANNNYVDIPNIVQIYGKDAVVAFFQFSTDFLNRIRSDSPLN